MNKEEWIIGLAQYPFINGDLAANQEMCYTASQAAMSKGVHLLIFPELAWSGYYVSKERFSELSASASPSSQPVRFFKKLSRETNTGIVFSFPEEDGDQLYITAGFVDEQEQQLHFYRKSKLWGREQDIFTAGPKKYTSFETRFGRIGLLICYDIEFPEPSRELAKQNTDIIICPSVWSRNAETRWNIQIPCRALDNQCYIAGANMVSGQACGQSQFVDPYGKVLTKAGTTEEVLLTARFNRASIDQARTDIPYLRDLDF